LHYQDEIDRLENAAVLKQDVHVKQSSEGLEFVFPADFDYKKITGHINLQRISDEKLDFESDLKLDSLSYFIPKENLVNGRYNLKLNWKYNGIPYQLKQKIDY
jgi:hypothetical protein